MEAKKEIVYRTYSSLLDRLGISYVEGGNGEEEEDGWLIHGTPFLENNWVLYITVKISEVANILKRIMPIIKDSEVSFRLIKNDEYGYRLNAGAYDAIDVGKYLTLYTKSITQAKNLVDNLSPLLQDYLGPEVSYALRIDKNIYGHWVSIVEKQDESIEGLQINFEIPLKKFIPFSIGRRYKSKNSRKMYGWFYLKDKVLRPGPKGDIFRAHTLKGMKLTSVVVKEGKHGVFEDFNGRDIKDRFLWQVKVLSKLDPHIPTARFIDYFESDQNCYLVIEYLEGTLLPEKIARVKDDSKWDNLSVSKQIELLKYYLKIVGIVRKIHSFGFVHRDIQDHNFIISDDGNVSIIDFELTYDLVNSEPGEPFLLGTLGYVSPEQMNMDTPTEQTDVYSLGALLAYFIVGEHPSKFIPESNSELSEVMNQFTDSSQLIEIIRHCLEPDPMTRMNMSKLEQDITKYLEYLHFEPIKTKNINDHQYEN